MKRQDPFAAGIRKMHEEKLDFYEHRREIELPAKIEQVKQFKLVLEDKAVLSDAMANAVFKDHSLLRNVRLKEKATRNAGIGKSSASTTDDDVVDEETLANIQQQGREHINRLRRLKGKSGSKLSIDEQQAIVDYIADSNKWIASVEGDDEYIDYVFKTRNILDDIEAEERRTQSYLDDENEDLYQRAVESVSKRRLIGVGGVVLLENNPTTGQEVTVAVTAAEPSTEDALGASVVQSDAFSRLRELQSRYFQATGDEDPTGLRAQSLIHRNIGFCNECHVELIINTEEACQSCPMCGRCERWADSSLRAVPFGDPVSVQKTKGKYDKCTYKDTWKKMVSGELNREIPDDDWSTIYLECVSRRLGVVTRELIRKILHSLGMTHYYKYTHMITNELNGVPLIKFSEEEDRTLDCMFDEAVIVFDKCPYEIKQRNNFISYAYFFSQACKMAGYMEYLPAFSLLCGRDNLKRHDRIWEWMCQNKASILGGPEWKFYPTV